MTELEFRIREVLGRYNVRNHYAASAEASRELGRCTARYAVFADGNQVTEPVSHAEAQRAARDCAVRDLLALVEAVPA